jgi:hypothetical protein
VIQLDWDWPSITFPDLFPVGGSMHLTLYPNGTYVFSGHFHDSGFPSYNTALAYVIKDSQGRAYTFTHQGHTGGTFGGDRNDDWSESNQNADIAANWDSIVNGLGYGTAQVNLDLGDLINAIKGAVGVVQQVITVVGPLLAL